MSIKRFFNLRRDSRILMAALLAVSLGGVGTPQQGISSDDTLNTRKVSQETRMESGGQSGEVVRRKEGTGDDSAGSPG